MLQLTGLTKRYGPRVAVDGTSSRIDGDGILARHSQNETAASNEVEHQHAGVGTDAQDPAQSRLVRHRDGPRRCVAFVEQHRARDPQIPQGVIEWVEVARDHSRSG